MARFGPETFAGVTLRNLVAADAPLFAEFHEKIARETTHTLQIPGQVSPLESVAARWGANEADPESLLLGALDARGALVGQLGFHSLAFVPGHPMTGHSGRFFMMITREFWGRGIGRRMLEILDLHAEQAGFTRIEARVRNENSRALRLYLKAGYRIEGEARASARVDGEYAHDLMIAKLLGDAAPLQEPEPFFAETPEPPYYAVIFSSRLSRDRAGYDETAARMLALAAGQPGFLGAESTRSPDGDGITVSYWSSLEAIRAWRDVPEHRAAQREGHERWYEKLRLRVSHVLRD
jgi:RimJ/RimL family protein N-acetyltransferase/heme-degrading monooxygenase HmoA